MYVFPFLSLLWCWRGIGGRGRANVWTRRGFLMTRTSGPRMGVSRLCGVMGIGAYSPSFLPSISIQLLPPFLPRPSFLYSHESSTGFSQHGDYVFGWKGDALQRAMNAHCTGDKCNVLDLQSTEDAVKCTVPRTVEEGVDGCKFFSAL
jgi:hypothetical protein